MCRVQRVRYGGCVRAPSVKRERCHSRPDTGHADDRVLPDEIIICHLPTPRLTLWLLAYDKLLQIDLDLFIGASSGK